MLSRVIRLHLENQRPLAVNNLKVCPLQTIGTIWAKQERGKIQQSLSTLRWRSYCRKEAVLKKYTWLICKNFFLVRLAVFSKKQHLSFSGICECSALLLKHYQTENNPLRVVLKYCFLNIPCFSTYCSFCMLEMEYNSPFLENFVLNIN